MEALTSVPIVKSVKSKEYILQKENRVFKIKIYLSSDITIEIIELDKIKDIFYSGTFSLDALIKLSKGFKICEDIKEAYDAIEQIFENKKVFINNINDKEISLIFQVYSLGGKVEDVNLTLNKIELNKNLLIEEIVKKVNELEEENKGLKKENSDLKSEITDLKKKLTKKENQNEENTISLNIDIRLYEKKKIFF